MAPHPTQIHSFSMYLSRLSISRVYLLHAPSLAFLGTQLSSWECNETPRKAATSRESHSIPANAVAILGWSAPSQQFNYTPRRVIVFQEGLEVAVTHLTMAGSVSILFHYFLPCSKTGSQQLL